MKNKRDYFVHIVSIDTIDLVSIDEDGFTVEISPKPPDNTKFVYIQYEKITWNEFIKQWYKYIKYIIKKYLKNLNDKHRGD